MDRFISVRTCIAYLYVFLKILLPFLKLPWFGISLNILEILGGGFFACFLLGCGVFLVSAQLIIKMTTLKQ